ncbi:PAS domain S-box protein [Thiomicrorhabdus sp. ZW0627]|uniref:PAS domain S-box protein n=1 Tax=Thiomicrorhabdus sp. ZW0627 TaxID=3039774 RepID=UPI0024371B6B|nr:PAS domain S-box protein [Thiomicrorhabdus sp. ZW0627]MDG6773820.1 PAS domain S-box protein [Thiomicrorhabdus sp. ZW0627]
MQLVLHRFISLAIVTLTAGVIIMLLFLGSYLYINAQSQEEKNNLNNERLAMAAQKVLDDRILYLVTELRFLSELPSTLSRSGNVENANMTTLQSILFEFARKQPSIDQVRLLGMDGQERIRINRINGQVEMVPRKALQNKKDRYYFSDAAALPKGGVAISRLDLNVENNRVELPLKPMIRLSAPVFDNAGNKIGVMVLNFLANVMLDQLKELRREDDQKIWLLDERLDWVIAPKGQMPWATQLEHKGNNLSNFLPETGRLLRQNARFQGVVHEADQNLFVAYVTPFKSVKLVSDLSLLVNRTPNLHVLVSRPKPNPWWEMLFKDPEIRTLFFELLGIVLLISFGVGLESRRKQQLIRKAQYQENVIEIFFEHAPDIIMIIGSNGEVHTKNRSAKDLLAMDLTDAEKNDVGLYTGEDRRLLWKYYVKDEDKDLTELVIKDKGGQRYFHRQGLLIPNEMEEDEPLVAIIMKEFTPLKLAQEKIIENEQKVRHLLDAAPDAILVTNAEGEILLTNKKAQEMFELSQEEFLQSTVEDLVPHPYRASHKGLRKGYQKSPEQRTMSDRPDIVAETKSGRKFYAEISLSPVRQNGDLEIISIVRDISDRKKLEGHLKQSQKMDALGQLTGGIAHDFNNLLTAIIGNLDLANVILDKKPEAVDKLREKLEVSLNAALKASKLTKRLLAFARKQALMPQLVDVGELIRDELSIIESASGKMVDIHVNVDDDLWQTVVDVEELTSALINLATNAKDAMPDGGNIYITVENATIEDENLEFLGVEIPEGDYVSIAFSDTGTGISSENLERVFEPFFTTKPKHKGTGLGLSMVFGFVKQSNGYLKVYSEQGIGTTFRILLPRYVPDEDGKGQTVKLSSPSKKNVSMDDLSGTGKILLVDDEPDLRKLAMEYLGSAGYEVFTARDAESALQVLETETFDLVVTDIVMPGENGFELALKIQDRYPGLPVVFSSGFPQEALQHTHHFKQDLVLLNKPYRKNELLALVKREIEKSKSNS